MPACKCGRRRVPVALLDMQEEQPFWLKPFWLKPVWLKRRIPELGCFVENLIVEPLGLLIVTAQRHATLCQLVRHLFKVRLTFPLSQLPRSCRRLRRLPGIARMLRSRNMSRRQPAAPVLVDTPCPVGDVTMLPASDVCCICLDDLVPGTTGSLRPVPLPVCTRHTMHLQCLAQWRVQASAAGDLLSAASTTRGRVLFS